MSDPNLFEPAWEFERDEVVRGVRLGDAAGGQAAPYHAHQANEELLIALSDGLELRTPEGRRTLSSGAVVAFPTGPDGAHRVRNPGDEPGRYLVISTMRFPKIAERLDTGTVCWR